MAASDAGARPAPRAAASILRADAEIIGPALIASLLVGLLVASGLLAYHGNVTGFVRFGRVFAARIRPPRGAVIDTAQGYDGQFFWAMAHDPLLLHARTVAAVAGQGFRLQRVAYPLLAALLAGGRPAAIPWALLAVNVLTTVAITVAVSRYARCRGWSPAWGLAVGLLPGFMFAIMGDLSDVLAVASMLAGLMMWERRRRRAAAALLTIAVLAREPMLLAVVAVAIDGALAARRDRPRIAIRRAITAELWPAAMVPAIVFAVWQIYIRLRDPAYTGDPATAFQPPFVAVWREAQHALHAASAVHGTWDLAYLGLMSMAIAAAGVIVRRAPRAPALAATLFGVTLLVVTFGNDWSYVRLSAPLFACLLLAGLERRSRLAMGLCAASAVLGMLVPLALA